MRRKSKRIIEGSLPDSLDCNASDKGYSAFLRVNDNRVG
jgi:hypothetical protein